MSTQSITLCEFGTISAGSGEQTVDHAYLPQKQFEQLENFVLANQREEPEFGQLMTVSVMRGYCCLILWTLFYAPIDLAFSAFSGSTEKSGSQRKKLLLMNALNGITVESAILLSFKHTANRDCKGIRCFGQYRLGILAFDTEAIHLLHLRRAYSLFG